MTANRRVSQASRRAPVNLDEALAGACEGVAGITPAQFRALMSPEDIADIETGAIHTKILCAYASPSPRDPLGTGGPGGDAMTTAALARNRS